jgi:hypothetical protein
VTDIERSWLAWLARNRFGSEKQLSRKFNVGSSMARRRTTRFRIDGFATASSTQYGAQQVWLPTRRGLVAAGLTTLDVPRYSASQFAHTSACVDVATTLEAQGHLILTERELRSARSGKTPTAQVRKARQITGIAEGPLTMYRADREHRELA